MFYIFSSLIFYIQNFEYEYIYIFNMSTYDIYNIGYIIYSIYVHLKVQKQDILHKIIRFV